VTEESYTRTHCTKGKISAGLCVRLSLLASFSVLGTTHEQNWSWDRFRASARGETQGTAFDDSGGTLKFRHYTPGISKEQKSRPHICVKIRNHHNQRSDDEILEIFFSVIITVSIASKSWDQHSGR
jgi:hypothetical protein